MWWLWLAARQRGCAVSTLLNSSQELSRNCNSLPAAVFSPGRPSICSVWQLLFYLTLHASSAHANIASMLHFGFSQESEHVVTQFSTSPSRHIALISEKQIFRYWQRHICFMQRQMGIILNPGWCCSYARGDQNRHWILHGACLLLYFVTVSSYTALHVAALAWPAASLIVNMNIREHVIKLKEMRFKTILNRMKSHCFVLTFHHFTELITTTWLELCLLRSSEDRGSKVVTKGLVSATTPAYTEHLPPTLTLTRNVTLMTAGHKNIINNTHCWLGNGKNQK